MKKTLFAASLLLGLCMGAQAGTTYFLDLSQSIAGTNDAPLAFTRVEGGLSTITTTDATAAPLYTANSDDQASATISFTFNFTAIKKDYDAETNNQASKMVLAGIRFADTANRYAAITIQRNSHGVYETMLSAVDPSTNNATNNPAFVETTVTPVFTSNGNEYVTYTLSTGPRIDNAFGYQAYDAKGNNIASAANYWNNTTAFQSVQSYLINTKYVTAVAVTDGHLTKEQIAAVSAVIPEPATATLSLLALAGLAARRRRK